MTNLLLGVFVILVLSLIVITVIDSLSLTEREGFGVVTDKIIEEARAVIVYSEKTATMVPRPKTWKVLVAVGKDRAWMSVYEEFYEAVSVNDAVQVTYTQSRIFGSLHVRQLQIRQVY